MNEVNLIYIAIAMSACILIPLAVNGVLAASIKLIKKVCTRVIPHR